MSDQREVTAHNWRTLARRQRWRHAVVFAIIFGCVWVVDWLEQGGRFSTQTWPLLMPWVLICGWMLMTGRTPAPTMQLGEYYRAEGLKAGDRSVVSRYPPVVQAALVRAAEAGEEPLSLLPVTQRLLWRMGIPAPPVAYMPPWLDMLILFASLFCVVPLWFFVQLWWNPAHEPELMRVMGKGLTLAVLVFAAIMAVSRNDTRSSLGQPRWREYRREWQRGSMR